MKFQRTDLIDRVKAEIARRVQAADERNAKAAQKHDQRRQEYLDKTGPAWKELADRIRARLRNGQPMTPEDIPQQIRGGYTSGHVRTFDDRLPDPYVADTEHLTTLLDLLNAASDDEITTTSLERMGFRMGSLFRAR